MGAERLDYQKAVSLLRLPFSDRKVERFTVS